MKPSANRLVFLLLLAVVVLAPLPLGSHRPWAWSLLGLFTGLLLVGWSALVLSGRVRAAVPVRWLLPALVPLALVLAWALIQTLDGVPAGWQHPLWPEAAQALGREAAGGGISVDAEMTQVAILRLGAYAGVFWLAAMLGRERSRARQALVAVAVAGTAYAGYGLLVHFAGWERILWLEKWAYPGDLTATFVNRNAYGAYAGLGLLACMGLFFHALRPARPGAARRAHDVAEMVLVRALPFLAAAVLIGSALLLSHSRGAFASAGAGMVVLLAAVVVGRVLRLRTALLLGVVLAGIGLAVLSVSGDGTVDRLARTSLANADEQRAEVYALTTRAVLDAPLTGHGFGAFLPAFRIYRSTALSTPLVWDFAHNVALESAMDLGIPAALALYGAVTAVVLACLRGLVVRRRDHIYPAVAVAAAVLVGGHGLVDFSAQMPAVAVTLALLLGIGFAQSRRSGEEAAGA